MNYMAQHGARLLDNGYSVIPIEPGRKSPGVYRGAFWAALPGWSQYCDCLPTDEEVARWSTWPLCGIGIACGAVAAVDIDILDSEVAYKVADLARRRLGDTPAVRIGRAPKTLLVYRTDEPFQPIKRHPVELLGHGNQFVAYHIHPDTGKPYEWPIEGLAGLDRGALPLITTTAAIEFMAAAYDLVPPEMRKAKLAGDGLPLLGGESGEQGGTVEAIVDALRFVPNNDLHYDDWIRIGHCIKGALGDAGESIWLAWSASSSKDAPAATAKAWKTFQPIRAGAGTIYHLAGLAGWRCPAGITMRASAAEATRSVDLTMFAVRPVVELGASVETVADVADTLVFEPAGGPVESTPIVGGPVEESAPAAAKPDLASIFAIPAKRRIEVIDWHEIPPTKPLAWLIKGVLPAEGLSVMYGESGSGKSFVATDLALHIAIGKPWRSKRTRQGGVVYIAAEGASGMRQRVLGWRNAHAAPVAGVPFRMIPTRVNLLDPKADTDSVIDVIGALPQAPALVVVDTVARAFVGGNENDSRDMGCFISNCDRIRESINSHVMLVHHAGKDASKGARGHGSLRAAVDTEIEVARIVEQKGCVLPARNKRVAIITKQKDGRDGERFPFALVEVGLGYDDDGDAVTTCVVGYDE